eukprot:Plantae.Rhodophyta-Hildenbrandia_rubra.ctg2824.p1 GENE.Plantae.Rhodophyta-Hildenbrandia_rubra.ctg2824~~Plantae.Rhodophyta-Hildenbrandia_rubra.ctg2824.p1  ORF type:complete len:526 (-),score=60.62 Plantae.Rhodophyta-Hildenbrandia_rubra.ctg2824:497-2074(-)
MILWLSKADGRTSFAIINQDKKYAVYAHSMLLGSCRTRLFLLGTTLRSANPSLSSGELCPVVQRVLRTPLYGLRHISTGQDANHHREESSESGTDISSERLEFSTGISTNGLKTPSESISAFDGGERDEIDAEEASSVTQNNEYDFASGTALDHDIFESLTESDEDLLERIDELEAFGAPDWANRILDYLDSGSYTIGVIADGVAKFHWTVSNGGTWFPWWGSLVLCAAALRLTLAPVVVFHLKERAKLFTVRKELLRINLVTNKLKAPFLKRMKLRWDMRRKAYETAGTSRLRMARYPFYVGLPATLLLSLGIRRVALNNVYDFSTGGALWFKILVIPDYTMILPMMSTGLFLHAVDRFKPRIGSADETTKKAVELLIMGGQSLALVLFPIYLKVISGLYVFWVSNGLLMLVDRNLYTSPSFRKSIGLPQAKDSATIPDTPDRYVLTQKDVRRDLKYVREEILDQDFEGRELDEDLVVELNSRLKEELQRRKIKVTLRSAIRQDPQTGNPYLSVFQYKAKTMGQ